MDVLDRMIKDFIRTQYILCVILLVLCLVFFLLH